MKTYVIIPAGGKGLRSGFAVPKQYVKFNGKELIVYTLEVFQQNKSINEIIIAAHPDYFPLLEKLKKKYKLTKVNQFVKGGKERQDSVFNALNAIKAKKNDFIAVHDAARPLLPQEVLKEALKTAKQKGNALVCIRAKDTLLKGKAVVDDYINRNEVFYVQTPQIFKYEDLMKAMTKAYKDKFLGTDESMLVNRMGKKVHIVEGSMLNFKATNKDDFELLKKLLSAK